MSLIPRVRRDVRAGVTLLVALMFPVLLGTALLGVDGARLYLHKLMVRQATQSAWQSNPCSVNSREAFPSVQSLKRPW